MKADRLYYDAPLLKAFEAKVTACRQGENEYLIALDRTAFYPEAGGQPWDTGCLTGPAGVSAAVTAVTQDPDGEVWHHTALPLPEGETVHGTIDWARRVDHMEQHAGEHLLASALWHLYGGVTRGLHTGHEDATIDVTLPDGRMHLTREEIARAEDRVNDKIRRNEPIRCYFPDDKELENLPLRKKPTVAEHVRVVQMGEDEYCPCGGTHPPYTGMIGLVKILSVTPSRGKMRVRFVCGGRALKVFRLYQQCAEEAVQVMNAPMTELADACRGALEREKAALKAAEEAQDSIDEQRALEAVRNAQMLDNGIRLIGFGLSSPDPGRLTARALSVCGEPGRVCIVTAPRGKAVGAAIAASQDVAADLRPLFKLPGARGGGRDRFVTGQFETDAPSEAFLLELVEQVRGLLQK